MPVPDIMVVAPPPIIQPKGVIASKFEGAEKRCVGLASELKKLRVTTQLIILMQEVLPKPAP